MTAWDVITPPELVWLDNYLSLWRSDLFWEVVTNTLYFIVLTVPLSVGCSLALALAANTGLRGITFFRTAYFLPVVSSMIAVALVWSWIFNPEYGLLNYLLQVVFGVKGPAWLDSTAWALPAMVIVTVWKGLGYSMVIFLAGLENIPQDLYHAATIDGAGVWKRFGHITFPNLSPTTFFVLVITLINAFQVFEQTYVLTRGGPANATLTMSYYIYQNALHGRVEAIIGGLELRKVFAPDLHDFGGSHVYTCLTHLESLLPHLAEPLQRRSWLAPLDVQVHRPGWRAFDR